MSDLKKMILAQTEKLLSLIESNGKKDNPKVKEELKKSARVQLRFLVDEVKLLIDKSIDEYKLENNLETDRPSKHKYFMDIAHKVKARSHDVQTKVGAVLVSNKYNSILGTGYNGFVSGADDSKLPKVRPEKYPYMQHAEKNLISNLIKSGGVSTNDSTMYCTTSPCQDCVRFLFQSGITKIIIQDKYRDFHTLKEMQDLQIKESTTPEGYTELSYVIKN